MQVYKLKLTIPTGPTFKGASCLIHEEHTEIYVYKCIYTIMTRSPRGAHGITCLPNQNASLYYVRVLSSPNKYSELAIFRWHCSSELHAFLTYTYARSSVYVYLYIYIHIQFAAPFAPGEKDPFQVLCFKRFIDSPLSFS
jgi:hypothetical protein